MKVSDMLKKLAVDDTVPVQKWKIEIATRWELTRALEPEESGGAVMSYEDNEGMWRRFAELDMSVEYGMHEWVDRMVIDDEVPIAVGMPFIDLFRTQGLPVTIRKPFSA